MRAVKVQPVVAAVTTGCATASLAAAADIVFDIGNMQGSMYAWARDDHEPMAMMALADALALILLERRGFTRQDSPQQSFASRFWIARAIRCIRPAVADEPASQIWQKDACTVA